MLTAIKRGFVLTKSVNAFQDGIHRRIAKVSVKSQPYLIEAYLIVAQIMPKYKTVSRVLIVQYCCLSIYSIFACIAMQW